MYGWPNYASPGDEFHGELFTTDITGLATEPSQRIDLFSAMDQALIVLGASDRVVLTDVDLYTTGDTNPYIFDGDDTTADPGEIFVSIPTTASGGNRQGYLATPHFCKPGTYPKVGGGAAGAIHCIVRGYIKRGG